MVYGIARAVQEIYRKYIIYSTILKLVTSSTSLVLFDFRLIVEKWEGSRVRRASGQNTRHFIHINQLNRIYSAKCYQNVQIFKEFYFENCLETSRSPALV